MVGLLQALGIIQGKYPSGCFLVQVWLESRQGNRNRSNTDGREAHEMHLTGSSARRGGPQSQDLNKMHPNMKAARRSPTGRSWEKHLKAGSKEWNCQKERACSENTEQILVTQDVAGCGEQPEERAAASRKLHLIVHGTLQRKGMPSS